MSRRSEIENTLREFIVSEFLDGDGGDLTPTTNLLALGIIDSLAMVSLRVFMERTFGVTVSDAVQPEDFRTVSSMVALIEGLEAAKARSSSQG
jgi:acyl carrier protein